MYLHKCWAVSINSKVVYYLPPRHAPYVCTKMSRFHSLAQGYVVTEPVQKIDNKLTTILYTHRYLDRQTTSELQTKWIKIRDIKIGPRLLLITNRSLICFIKERMMMRMRMRMMMMMMMMMDVAYALSIGNKINDLGMTLNWPWTAIMRFVALQICISEPATKNWMKIDPNYQRQKCSPWILVSSKVSFFWGYLRGFAGEGASNKSGVVENGDFRFFRSLYLPNLHN